MQRGFAWVTAHSTGVMHRHYGERKERLFSGIGGEVVEIGPGAGANFAYYPAGTRVVAVEPNPYMHRYLQQAAEEFGHELRLVPHGAERLPLADESASWVVSTLVLCSVSDPEAVLREIRRVLVPGGRFVFIEHVAAPTGTSLRRRQDRIVRPWRFIGDGCHPNRDTHHTLRRAGFSQLELEPFTVPVPLGIVSPHIAGAATR